MIKVQSPANLVHSSPVQAYGKQNSLASQVQSKLKHLWESINCCCCYSMSKKSLLNRVVKKELSLQTVDQKVQSYIAIIDQKEAEYKKVCSVGIEGMDQKTVNEHKKLTHTAKQEWVSSIKKAFEKTIGKIKENSLDPLHLPENIALKLTEILWRDGLMLYANSDAPDPFKSSLSVFKAALVMQHYALGLADSSFDLSEIKDIEELFTSETLSAKIESAADAIADTLEPSVWAEKAVTLDQRQFVIIPQLLRYIDGAMGYLGEDNLPRSAFLLGTAEVCLNEALENPNYDQKEIKNLLAELIYNNLTGIAAKIARKYEDEGEIENAKIMWVSVEGLWNKAIELSADPQKMIARCNNKRTFVRKLTPEQNVELYKLAVEAHLALPKERQNLLLLALAWNNLSHAQIKVGNKKEGRAASDMAMEIAAKCAANSDSNVQLSYIINHAKQLASESDS